MTRLAHLADVTRPQARRISNAWRLVEPITLPRGRLGPLRDPHGAPLHGTYDRPDGWRMHRVLANNGHVLANWRYPVGLPHAFTSPLHSDLNPVLEEVGWDFDALGVAHHLDRGELVVSQLVLGRKPFALTDTTDPREAEARSRRAAAAGLAVHRFTLDGDEGGRQIHVVAVARRERLWRLAPLEALEHDLTMAVPNGELYLQAKSAVRALRDLRPSDFLDDDDLLTPLDIAEHIRSGVILGHTSAVIAAAITSDTFEEDMQRTREALGLDVA